MSFAELGLAPELGRAVADQGYVTATPIQRAAIPAVLAGRDVLAGAQTGTGKTAAFVLPILQRLGAPQGAAPRALVLTPTRELAAQVAASAATYGRYSGARIVVMFRGVGDKPRSRRCARVRSAGGNAGAAARSGATARSTQLRPYTGAGRGGSHAHTWASSTPSASPQAAAARAAEPRVLRHLLGEIRRSGRLLRDR
jgi:ATP-dependent helicase YprA (DUF1998 family)